MEEQKQTIDIGVSVYRNMLLYDSFVRGQYEFSEDKTTIRFGSNLEYSMDLEEDSSFILEYARETVGRMSAIFKTDFAIAWGPEAYAGYMDVKLGRKNPVPDEEDGDE